MLNVMIGNQMDQTRNGDGNEINSKAINPLKLESMDGLQVSRRN